MSRFSYVKYDNQAASTQADFKAKFEDLEQYVVNFLPDGRAKSLVLTKLEEAYMWIGKAIRDDQMQKRGGQEQPERKDD